MEADKPRILILDDDPLIIKALQHILARHFTVTATKCSKSAVEKLPEGFDLFLCDQRMPGLTGLELFDQIAGRFPETKRVLLTAADPEEADPAELQRLGVAELLRKPVKPAYLVGALREILAD